MYYDDLMPLGRPDLDDDFFPFDEEDDLYDPYEADLLDEDFFEAEDPYDEEGYLNDDLYYDDLEDL
jgi:hypothetical protein